MGRRPAAAPGDSSDPRCRPGAGTGAAGGARELSDTELGFRSFEDYISKYRRVLDYFDAVKIGLTATPALHTTQIFGAPIYTYSYREAVINGYLVDHEPPVQINTELSTSGITWKVGEQVSVFDSRRNQIDLFTTPDEIKFDVEDFNRKVIAEAVQPGCLQVSGAGTRPCVAPENPDLLRQRRPR